MTMIAIATHPDRAEFITDSLSYTAQASELGHATKHMPITHLDAAVLTQGDELFGIRAKMATLTLANDLPTLDQVIDGLPDVLRQQWTPYAHTAAEAVVFVVGYSHRADHFTAVMFAAEDDFAPVQISGLFVIPSPWSYKPSDLELARLRATSVKHGVADETAATWAGWQTRPVAPVPASPQDWADLALQVRGERALESFARVLVAGDVHLTEMYRGAYATARLLAYNDQGEEFEQLVAYTQHPQGQLVECHCGSGQRFRDCHLAQHYADGHTCDCGSGKAFRDCCMFDEPQPDAPLWTAAVL